MVELFPPYADFDFQLLKTILPVSIKYVVYSLMLLFVAHIFLNLQLKIRTYVVIFLINGSLYTSAVYLFTKTLTDVVERTSG